MNPAKPNFLIIGAARSGTTALARTLSQHPDVFLSEPKEVHFMAHVDQPFTYTGPGDDQSINVPMVTDIDDYFQLFQPGADRLARGEGSVSTLYYVERSIPAIDKFADPGVRLIAVLREPAARAHSAYLYLRGRGFEDSDSFESALAKEPERIEAGYHHMWHFRGMSRYGEQLPQFVERFGDRVLVLIQEEYRDDPDAHLKRVASFLGIDETFAFQTDIDVNRGGEPRSRLLTELFSTLRSSPPIKTAVKAVTPERLRERIRSANLQQPPKPVALSEIWAEFESDRRIVEEVLGRPIASWRNS